MSTDNFTAKPTAAASVHTESSSGRICLKRKLPYLIYLICALLLLLCLTCITTLFLFFYPNPVFFIVLVVITVFLTVCAILLGLLVQKTERYLLLFLTGGQEEPLKPWFWYSPAVERLVKNRPSVVPRSVQQEENRRKAQYLALQNQINPHFLYNTLEAIRSEALVGGLLGIAGMTETLANFFRYTISNTSELVTLTDEIKNVQDYFTIQRFRFGERINLDIQIPLDGQLQFYRLPKLILQPIVENAIIHGLEDRISEGKILISADVTQTKLIIAIEDNGCGMEHEKLIAINRQLNTRMNSDSHTGRHGGIAMYNVNDRLKLLFGQEYGLIYKSMPQIGTRVEIVLPLECADL